MCIRICIEVGHVCKIRRSFLGLFYDWRVWVRGAKGDISPFVEKVVFRFYPPSIFVHPKKVVLEPPYELENSNLIAPAIEYLLITIYLKDGGQTEKLTLNYRFKLQEELKGISKFIFHDIRNPSELLKENLLKYGGEIVVDSNGA